MEVFHRKDYPFLWDISQNCHRRRFFLSFETRIISRWKSLFAKLPLEFVPIGWFIRPASVFFSFFLAILFALRMLLLTQGLLSICYWVFTEYYSAYSFNTMAERENDNDGPDRNVWMLVIKGWVSPRLKMTFLHLMYVKNGPFFPFQWFLLRSGPRFSYRALEVPEPKVRKRLY